MSITEKLKVIQQELEDTSAQLVAVSKTKPIDVVMKAYNTGQRVFGENKVQELVEKYESMPKDIKWHMIGHLQRNKVKYIAPFVDLIHGVDSFKLLKEINKEGKKNDRVIPCLLQVFIADEDTKFGFEENDILQLLKSNTLDELQNVSIIGLMGMATNTNDTDKISNEFAGLKDFFEQLKNEFKHPILDLKEISMGMSGDYKTAITNGSTLVRIGSTIFGARNYTSS